MFLQQRRAISEGIDLVHNRQLIHEAFHHEGILGVPDATPEGRGNTLRRFVAHVVHRQVGKTVGPAGIAHGIAIDAVGESVRRPARDDGAAGDLVGPGDRPALLVQAGGQVVVVERSQAAVAGILLAGVDDLHRVIHLFGNFHRMADEVRFQAPAETAAEQLVVHHHLVFRQAGELRGKGLGP